MQSINLAFRHLALHLKPLLRSCALGKPLSFAWANPLDCSERSLPTTQGQHGGTVALIMIAAVVFLTVTSEASAQDEQCLGSYEVTGNRVCQGIEHYPGPWTEPYGLCGDVALCASGYSSLQCTARGGTPGSMCGQCIGGATIGEANHVLIGVTAAESFVYTSGDYQACDATTTVSDWGASIPDNYCVTPPQSGVSQYQAGIETLSYKLFRTSGMMRRAPAVPSCTTPYVFVSDASRSRQLLGVCSQGSVPRTQFGQTLYCARQPTDHTCPADNPVSLGNGAKLHTEIDFGGGPPPPVFLGHALEGS
jgi:hypothetical protein